MTVRAAGPEDLDEVMEVERACFGDWDAGDRQAWSRSAWRADLLRAAAPSSAAGRLVLIDEGDAGPRGVADFAHVVDSCDLDRIMVIPEARRAGLAGRLLEDGMDWAAGRGAEQILLEVRPGNVAALRLYQSHGFSAVARRDHYYADGADALVMSAPLAPDRPGAEPSRPADGPPAPAPDPTGGTADHTGSNEERHV